MGIRPVLPLEELLYFHHSGPRYQTPWALANFKPAIRILYAVEDLDDAYETLFVAFPIFTGIVWCYC